MHRCPTLFFLFQFFFFGYLAKKMIFILPETSLGKKTALAFFLSSAPLRFDFSSSFPLGLTATMTFRKINQRKVG